MQYYRTSLRAIEKKIRAHSGCVLMLDFDGTLSPLAQTPEGAFLPKHTKILLQKISRLVPTAIVTGRSLMDIKKKVGINNVIYAGNHGAEWDIAGTRGRITIPANVAVAISALRTRLRRVCRGYSGSLLENKGVGIALHYRRVQGRSVKKLLHEAKRMIAPFQGRRLVTATESKKTLDIRPMVAWHKGYWAKFLCKKLGKLLFPIYVGDDLTDEDAFRMLRHGITITVGKKGRSTAQYYCRNIKQVRLFLRWLLSVLGEKGRS